MNRKRYGKLHVKSVIADRADPSALAMYPHNSQLPQTLKHPERLGFPFFHPLPETGRRRASAGGQGGGGGGRGGTLSSLRGFRVVMDMVVVISQRLLLPTLPHLRPAKCRYSAGRRLMTSKEVGDSAELDQAAI